MILLSGRPVFSQSSRGSLLDRGIALYGESRWREAVIELRRAGAEAGDEKGRADALYWTGLAELSAGEYEAALADMEELELVFPGYSGETLYHKGRVLYYLGRYDEAVVLLREYADREGGVKKAAALYWMGECLFSLGRLDQARDLFTLITGQYPQSAKYEASAYRLALINQKKRESELLELLKWSHEESLNTAEDFRRRERSYDQALIAYQKRLAEMMKEDPASSGGDYRSELAAARARIAELEAMLGVETGETDRQRRLRELKNQAERMEDGILRTGRNGGGGGL
ncbi:MAG: tetratricopeptide repeat protein [Treponema sp.]|jgi:tetratricopeptide (TPR) repeat protein|nr:tetratricopeptide repeat protein [Treponema sp.]